MLAHERACICVADAVNVESALTAAIPNAQAISQQWTTVDKVDAWNYARTHARARGFGHRIVRELCSAQAYSAAIDELTKVNASADAKKAAHVLQSNMRASMVAWDRARPGMHSALSWALNAPDATPTLVWPALCKCTDAKDKAHCEGHHEVSGSQCYFDQYGCTSVKPYDGSSSSTAIIIVAVAGAGAALAAVAGAALAVRVLRNRRRNLPVLADVQ